jgi:hypothetical protein
MDERWLVASQDAPSIVLWTAHTLTDAKWWAGHQV